MVWHIKYDFPLPIYEKPIMYTVCTNTLHMISLRFCFLHLLVWIFWSYINGCACYTTWTVLYHFTGRCWCTSCFLHINSLSLLSYRCEVNCNHNICNIGYWLNADNIICAFLRTPAHRNKDKLKCLILYCKQLVFCAWYDII